MKLFVPLLFITFMLACNSSQLYKHYIEIPNGIWRKDQAVVLRYDNEDGLENAAVWLTVRCGPAVIFDTLAVRVTRTTPSLASTVRTHILPIQDAQGYSLGEDLGDYWDYKLLIQPSTDFLEKGMYEYDVRHLLDIDSIGIVLDVGLLIEQNEENSQ